MAAKTPQHHSRRPPRVTEDAPTGVVEAAEDLHASDGQHEV